MGKNVKTFVIDLFCGAGGTSTAIFESKTNIEVIACVNHDENAILSHSANYPNCKHFIEDIRTIGLQPIKDIMDYLRILYPGCKFAVWASLECTNHSKAKGGQSRDADSRSLADHLVRYIEELNPDFLWIENVREFMEWGPLRMKEGKKSTKKYCELAVDKKGEYIFIPIKEERGIYYNAWLEMIKGHGFNFDYRILNSANFGAVTSRERYFAQFAREAELISWPEQTHFKKVTIKGQKKWQPVRKVLDLKDEGVSIFERKKALCDNTLRRIYAGLMKFVANGDDSFVKKYYSGLPNNMVVSLNSPAPTLRTKDGQAIVKCVFLAGYYGGSNCFINVEKDPAGTLGTHDTYGKIEAQFINSYYSGGGQTSSINNPAPTITNVPKQRLASVKFVDNQYGQSKPTGTDQPIGTMTPTPKQNIVSVDPFLLNANSSTSPAKDLNDPSPTLTQRTHLIVKPWLMPTNFDNVGSDLDNPSPVITANRKYHYIVNPSWFNQSPSSIENPSPTIVARQDKAPLSLISTEKGSYGIVVFESDSDIMVEIKKFMAAYGIVDIKMRMLQIPEMLRIQGFPNWYRLIGTQTEQKKYIGNSVEVTVGKCMFKAIDKKIQLAA